MAIGLLFLYSTSLYSQYNQQWDILYGGNNFDELHSVIEVSDGYVFGAVASASVVGDPPPTAGSSDYWIYKTDFEGNILWSYVYGGNNTDILQKMIQTQDGGFLMAGFSFSNASAFKSEDSRGERDVWLVKVDADGLFSWEATFGGDQEDYATSIIQAQDGTYYFGGWTGSLVSGEVSSPSRGGQFDCWVGHVDASGNYLDDYRFGGPNRDRLFDIDQITGGDILLVGLSDSNMGGEKTEDSFGGEDVWVIRMNLDGSMDWNKTYGGSGKEQGQSLQEAPSGGYLIGAFSNSPISGNKTAPNIGGADYWLLKIDDLGNIIYDRTYGGPQDEEIRELKINDKGLYYLGGRSNSNIGTDKSENNRGKWDYWIVVIDDDDNVFYDKTLGGEGNDLLRDFEILDEGGILWAGYTESITSGDITGVNNGFNDNWVVLSECTLDNFLDLGEDQMVCEFTNQLISANTGQANVCAYLWNDGSTEIERTVFVEEDIFYAVTVTDLFGCQAIDTINFTIFDAPEFDLGAPTIRFCISEDTLLSTGLNAADHTFLWNDLSMDSARILSVPGIYNLTVTDTIGCVFSDTVVIENFLQPTFDLGTDLTFCEGDSRTLVVDDPGPLYEWSVPNNNLPTLTVSEAATYLVTVTNTEGCVEVDSISVTVNEVPTVNLGSNQDICEGDSAMLDASLMACPSCTYLWEDMSINPIREVAPLFNSTYTVVVTNGSMCTSNDEISVNVFPKSLIRVNALTCDPAEVRNDTVFLQNRFDCDSLTIFNIVLLPSDTLRFNEGTCDPDQVGRDTMFLTNSFGCDSLRIVTYFLLPSSLENISSGTCDLGQVGIDTLFLLNEFGCDSTVIREYTALPSTENTFNFVSCDSLEVGIDTLSFINEFGCDSIIINVTTQLGSDITMLNEPVCFTNEVRFDTLILGNDVGCDSLVVTNFFLVGSDTIVFRGFTCDPLEVKNDTVFIQNSLGCDSLIVDIVDLAPSTIDDVLIFTCDLDQVGRDTINETNIFGCDSIIYQTFELLRSDTVFLSQFICDAPAFQDTSFLINALGCDSLVVTVFEEALSNEIALEATTCDETLEGIQVFNFVNQFGCDSIVTIDFELVEAQIIYLEVSTCNPSQFMPDTMVFSTALCDSIVITTFNVQEESVTTLLLVSCDMEDVGTFSTVLTNQHGCDSTITQIVSFAEDDLTLLTAFECGRMDTLVVENNFINQFGCDSIVMTTTFPGLDTTFNIANVCDPVDVFRDEAVFISIEGCDSVVVDMGVLSNNFETVFEIFTCDEDMVATNTVTLTSQEGCDSVVIFNTVLGEIELIQNIRNIACNQTSAGQISVQGNSGQLPYLYNIDDGAFSEQNTFNDLDIGTYQVGVQDADGCESFAIAEITEETGVTITDLPDFIQLEFGDPLILTPQVEGEFIEFFWTGVDSLLCEDCFGQDFIPIVSSTLTFNVISIEGCLEKQQVIIAVAKNYDVYIPNAFSPNGDNINDFFMIFGGDNVLEIKSLSLYSRWGELVYEGFNLLPNDELTGWDGKHRGEAMNPGVFIFKAQIEFIDGFVEDFEGELSLIR